MKNDNQQQGCDCDHLHWNDDGKNTDSTAIETAMTGAQVQVRRSRSKAGATAETVNKIATITDSDYCHALTPKQDKLAFLLPINPAMAESLTFEDGVLSMGDFKLRFDSCYSKEQLLIDRPRISGEMRLPRVLFQNVESHGNKRTRQGLWPWRVWYSISNTRWFCSCCRWT
ncbi:MAG: hypothetical protein K2O11_00085 [Oscillospiraceae bacterium]|nr:hypothetical protein [Oscillospiraceae bacterium]